MQPFHKRSIPQSDNRDEYLNNTHVAVDWPVTFDHDGRTYTVELHGSSKSFPHAVEPTNIRLLITAGKGYSLKYFVSTSSPTWSYIETFIGSEDSSSGDELPAESISVFTRPQRYALEEKFLSLCTYQPVQVSDWKGGSIEDVWNQRNALAASNAKAESDADERERHNGMTWQEQHDTL
ncbi:hypothetical protein [Arsenicibacter rosenii]|uniref:Uncharacterized protein n=1 Tax=Arsenicibacter rosenii TaxID=1750698 RepID=A0A1S2VAL9_9BACT|nr:hypothetical protein [Arsenicibacter rosenii]OIN55732.1 hypothetical protein BLX24_28365 [Arsenicibacter rosenii]